MAQQITVMGILLILLLTGSATEIVSGETHTDCGLAQTSFSFCVDYILGLVDTLSPKCCMGANDVEELVSFSLRRRGMCLCLGQMLEMTGGKVDGGRTASLARKCNVKTQFFHYLPSGLEYGCRW